jgi:hypothetical protein
MEERKKTDKMGPSDLKRKSADEANTVYVVTWLDFVDDYKPRGDIPEISEVHVFADLRDAEQKVFDMKKEWLKDECDEEEFEDSEVEEKHDKNNEGEYGPFKHLIEIYKKKINRDYMRRKKPKIDNE